MLSKDIYTIRFKDFTPDAQRGIIVECVQHFMRRCKKQEKWKLYKALAFQRLANDFGGSPDMYLGRYNALIGIIARKNSNHN